MLAPARVAYNGRRRQGDGRPARLTGARYPLDTQPKRERGFSRRQILKSLPLAVAGAVVAGVATRVITGVSRRRRQAAGLPEGSIFSPRRDRS